MRSIDMYVTLCLTKYHPECWMVLNKESFCIQAMKIGENKSTISMENYFLCYC